ncbi:23S rRNA (adenine(2030)-N(6))-methyltransferase RlmJ [Cereibacter changlensis JA139]|uniref:Ribosomal RNA large subunit methyltransferase J n=2 Tax=Cereibacter changlensis TaxID=402884 RepID=A0A2T4JVC8_9RHOB|nr:23S rRNA (adenine(2030)-N(6))-methyltransferase RlmJ [Cereibacter changlensis]PTE21871.1 23S rRNA (adenine(2030)-N(6))-methyltransferase RlmJ [Cereibacter changlensis JA139]PZX51614.1 23S rRNA (adenine2030-N6)-methyltransferase [Cereibacter changlensis]
MLSYQHLYHAGNLADVHKHALLCVMLDYLTQKDKPVSYIETHAGRGLYDLAAPEAVKTGEAAQGISVLEQAFAKDHPYRRRLSEVRAQHGPEAYPGSPLLAALSLRETDTLHLAELHPQEHQMLTRNLLPWGAHIHQADGFQQALALTPPTPRRGLMLIDPSFEVKADYTNIPKHMAALNRKWNVGVIALWYPLLPNAPHRAMLEALEQQFPEALRHEVRFPPVRDGHGLVGSGMFIVNAPWGTEAEAKELTRIFNGLSR